MKAFLLLIAFASLLPRLAAQPVNDNFTNATAIAGANGTISGSTIGGTVEPGEPFNLYGRHDHSVWYRWTAPASGFVAFDTLSGSFFDTVLSVYAGSNLTTLIQLDSDDDGAGFPWSRVVFPALAGESYHLAVDGFAGTAGFFNLNWGTGTNTVVASNEVVFSSENFPVGESTPGFVTIAVVSGGGITNTTTVDYYTSDGTAVAGADYLGAAGTLTFEPGDTLRTFNIPILDNPFQNTNKTILLNLANVTGGAVLGFQSNSVVTIVDNETPPFVSGAGEFNIVWPDTPEQATFFPGTIFLIPNSNQFFFSSFANYVVTENETFSGGIGGGSAPTVNIFPARSVRGALITVKRSAPAVGRVLVDYHTTNLFATNFAFTNLFLTNPIARPFFDFTPVSGTLLFDDHQMSANFVVPVVSTLLSNSVWFNVVISNPRPAPEEDPSLIVPTIGPTNYATVEILRVNRQQLVNFERATWRVDEYGSTPQGTTNVIIPGDNFIDIDLIYPPGGPNVSATISATSRRYVGSLLAGSDYIDPTAVLFDNTPFTDGTGPILNQADITTTTFTVAFGAGQVRNSIRIPIVADGVTEFNEDIILQIVGTSPAGLIGRNRFANLTVCFDDQPAGAADREWNPEGVLYTNPRFYTTPGANHTVSAVVIQPDQKAIIGGDFDHVNSFERNHVARFNGDGSLDVSFTPGTGADGAVNALVLYPASAGTNAGKILIAGSFSSYNGTSRSGLARLHTNGTLDVSFSPGNGADGVVRTLVLQNDGKVIVAGDFSFFNDLNVNGIMRVNPDGSLDNTFNPGFGANAPIWSLVLDEVSSTNRTIYAAGDFTSFNNQPRNRLVRLTDSGAVDLTFDPGLGADNAIYALALQNDGRILIGGAFSMYHTLERNGIARINLDGTIDETYNIGSGVNDSVYAITLQPDGKALLGGIFTSVNKTRRMGLARLFTTGSLDTSFMDTAYNQFAGLPKTFSFDNPSFINAIALQANGDLMIGGSFTNLGGNLSVNYPQATNTFGFIDTSLPISGRTNGHNSGHHRSAPFTRQDKTTRFNVARIIGGYTPGPGNIEYDPASLPFTIDENSGNLPVTLRRVDGRLGTARAATSTTNITAQFPQDYSSITSTQTWSEYNATINAVFVTSPISVGYVGNGYFNVPILDDALREGDETFGLAVANAFGGITLSGEFVPLGPAIGHADTSTARISDNDFDKGILNFQFGGYTVNEAEGTATISVIRTNGSSGTVTVDFLLRNGTATGGVDYTNAIGSRTLRFLNDDTNETFTIPILNNPEVEFDETVILILTNATGGAKLPGGTPTSIATATLTIVDDDFLPGRLQFSTIAYTNNENDVTAAITVTRTGGNLNNMSVDYQTMVGTATPGADYTPTNGTLTWADGDTAPRTIHVPLASDGVVEGPESVLLRLSNPSLAGALGARTNATLWINDGDAFGVLSFSQPSYEVDENGAHPTITVVRSGGSAGTVSANFGTAPIIAVPGSDYTDTNGTLTFLPGEFSKSFRVPISDNIVPDGDKSIRITLSSPVNAVLGAITNVVLTIVDNESVNLPAGSLDTTFSASTAANAPVYALARQVDGRIIMAGDFTLVSSVPRNRLARLYPNGLLDNSFDIGPGANDSIRTMALTSEGKLLVGGIFTSINGTNRNRVARLSTDGKVDIAFNPGAGADNPVFALALQPNEKVLVGGSFSTFNNITRPGLVRLNTNGIVDTTFNTGGGFNGTVYAIAVQNDGKVLVGGEFISFNGVARTNLVRLNANGSLDLTFSNLHVSAPVRAIFVQPDARILIGGSFTNIGGATRRYLARLDGNGGLDAGFLAGGANSGADNTVYTIQQQVDGKLIVAGDFQIFNGVTRNGLTRLNDLDGGTDPTINFGSGADGFVAALIIQPDRRIVIGGGFTHYDDQPRQHIARIYGGSIEGSGSLEFSRPEFQVSESTTNALITVRRRGGTTGAVSATGFTTNGTAIAGVDYLSISNILAFPEGETRQVLNVPIIPNTTLDGNRTVRLELANFAGVVAGPQPVSTLVILDDESGVGFSLDNFAVNENAVSGSGTVTLTRGGATNTQVSIDIATVAGGTATALVDYIPTNGTVVFLPGEVTKFFNVRVFNDAAIEGNESILLALSNPTNISVLGLTNTVLNVIDNNFAAGQLVFQTNNFQLDESGGAAIVTVLRTNGSLGIVRARLTTSNLIATAFADYVPTNTFVTFAEGETVKSVAIPILQDTVSEPDETVLLTLSQPEGGVSILTTNSLITIFDDEVVPSYLTFETNNFFVDEFAGFATINVIRTNSRRGFLTVDFSVTDGSALVGQDYFGTNGTLTFIDGDNIKAFTIPIINDLEGEGAETIKLTLFNLVGSNAPVLAGPTSTLNIVDDDSALRFSSSTYVIGEAAGAALITVERVGFTNSDATVTYLTGSGGTAVGGLDYTPVSGTLFWPAGDGTPKTFSVPIFDNTSLNPDRTVQLTLTNAIGVAVYVGFPSNAVLTITNDETQNPVAGPVDPTFNGNFGANGSVQSISYDAFSRLYAAGDFTRFHGLAVNRLVRLATNGAVDRTFNIGTGPGQIVYSVVATTNGAYIAGAFTNVNGVSLGRVARLLENGTVDVTFATTNGADADVRALALVPSGQVVIGGDFLAYNGSPSPRLARVNPDGTLDPTFALGGGPNGTVRAVAVQANGQVIIGGDFTTVNGFFISRIARLNLDGSLDTTFDVGLGADATVNTIAIQADGKVLIGGEFVTINGVPRDRLARLNADGSVDVTFIIGDGADDVVRAVALELDGHVLVAGAFNSFNGNSLRGVARLNPDGSLDPAFNIGSGADAQVNSLSVVTRPLPPTVAVMDFNTLPASTTSNSFIYSSHTENFLTFGSVVGGTFQAVSNGFRLTGAELRFFQSPYEITLNGGYAFSLQSMNFTGLTNPVTVYSSSGGAVQVLADGTYFFDATFSGVTWVRINVGGVVIVDDIIAVPGADAFATPSFAIGGDFQKFNNVSRGGVAVLGSGGSATFDFDPRNIAERSVYALGIYTNQALPGTIGKVVVGGDYTALVGVNGINRLGRLNLDGSLDTTFASGVGADAPVRALAVQPDGRTVIGGYFTSYDFLSRAYLARVNADGSLDNSFNFGAGLDNAVLALALQPDGKVVVGGLFTTVYGVPRNSIARVHANGTVDAGFTVGAGADGAVRAVALQADGKVVIGGDFQTVNGAPRSHVARLNANGTVDATFNPGLGADAPVRAIAITSSGEILIGGSFTNYNGAPAPRLARLTTTGALDGVFNPGSGANDFVSSIVIQPDGLVLVGGSFTTFNGQVRNRLVRLTAAGDLDPTINFGAGANDLINTVALQNYDGKIVIGGQFTEVDGLTRVAVARLFGGTNTGSGSFQFSAPVFFVNENIGSAALTVVRTGGTDGPASVAFSTGNGSATAPGDYTATSGTLNFAPAESVKQILVPLIDNTITNADRMFSVTLSAPSPGSSLGSNVVTTVVIQDNDSVLGFSAASYLVNEAGVVARITVQRTGGAADPVAVEYATGTNGTATAGLDFTPAGGILTFAPGVRAQTFDVLVTDDLFNEFNETVPLTLLNPAGPAALGLAAATLTIVENDAGAGVITFGTNVYFASEDAGFGFVEVLRTNGHSGAVAVNFQTLVGTATPGADYVATNGIVSFGDGVTSVLIGVRLVDNGVQEGDETVPIQLFGPSGGATLGLGLAALTIVDNDAPGTFVFSAPVYSYSESNAQATITIIRTNGNQGAASVTLVTSGGTATPTADYAPLSNAVSFASGQTVRTVTIPLIQDGLVEGTETVGLLLDNPTAGTTALGTSTLQIIDDEVAVGFSAATYDVTESSTNVTITLIRTGDTNNPLSVLVNTSDGTAFVPGDYLANSVLMSFAAGQTSRTFTVTLVEDTLAEGDEFVNLTLSNPSPGLSLGPIATSRLNILDNDTAVYFSAPVYATNEATVVMLIPVLRSGYTGAVSTVQCDAGNGTATAFFDYFSAPATLTFAAGVTSQVYSLTLLDDFEVEGNETIGLTLGNPTGAFIGAQSSAVINIVDNDTTIGFTLTNYVVNEKVTNALVTIVRNGAASQPVTVQFRTANGTASNGVDYVFTSNNLSWAANDIAPRTVAVPVLDDALSEGSEYLWLQLLNPSNAVIDIATGSATLTIVDNAGAIAFTSPSSSVVEGSSNAFINLVRTGGSNGTVSVDWSVSGGTATAGSDYLATTGTVVFASGESSKPVLIPISDDGLVEGIETVALILSNPSNGSRLGSPAAATLSILDNDSGIIVGAGTALISESLVPANQVIDPGELVTIQFGLRNAGVVDANNVSASLVYATGVTHPTAQIQNYGSMPAGGNTVSRPFSFTAVGTNGSRITATLLVTNNGLFLGPVAFDFVLGSQNLNFQNANAISLTVTGAANPYPATINVSGLAGPVNRLTVTLNGITHPFPDDLDVLLVSPTGTKVVLMSDAGGGNALNNTTITFDDAAGNAVPDNTAIASGTFRPANYLTQNDPFPAPAPVAPYATALSAFIGGSPNGVWSLYITDDSAFSAGTIAGGWSLSISTADTVVSGSDVAVVVTDSPDPVATGGPITYTVAVTNFGPATATSVMVTNLLPTAANFVSVVGPGTHTLNGGVLVTSLGSLVLGSGTTFTVTMTAPATNTLLTFDSTVTATEVEPNSGNNHVSVKTTVGAATDVPPLFAARKDGQLVLSWQDASTNVVLRTTSAIGLAADWGAVTNAPVVSNGVSTVTMPMGGGLKFFRLQRVP